jgi:hypothetical protein
MHMVSNIPIASAGELQVDLLLNGLRQASHSISIEAGPTASAEQPFE